MDGWMDGWVDRWRRQKEGGDERVRERGMNDEICDMSTVAMIESACKFRRMNGIKPKLEIEVRSGEVRSTLKGSSGRVGPRGDGVNRSNGAVWINHTCSLTGSEYRYCYAQWKQRSESGLPDVVVAACARIVRAASASA